MFFELHDCERQDKPAVMKQLPMCSFAHFSTFFVVETMKWARPRLPRAERVCGLCRSGAGDELHMVTECPGYSVVRERHSGLFECVGGVPGLLDRAVTSEQLRLFML
jgi:hypothetical protein